MTKPIRGRLGSFHHAIAGIRHAFLQPNFRIQATLGAAALLLGAALHVTSGEWVALLLTSLAVLSVEMLNTAIEAVVDLASPEHHHLARVAKDVAAGAVLMAAFGSLVVAAYIFIPRIMHLLGH